MGDLKFIVMTTSFGGRDISSLRNAVPGLIECVDHNHDAMGNFLNSMIYTTCPCVHLEDDIELCDGFLEKITHAVSIYPNNVINFFSLRSKDYILRRPYFELGSRYMMNQCFYLPEGYGPMIAEFYASWGRKSEHPTGYDILMADFLKSRREKYVQWFPHLVNHIECRSLINPKRSSKRTDKNFNPGI